MSSDKRTQQVNLGCTTFLVIAVIVMIFSNSGRDTKHEVQDLRKEVHDLKVAVEAQTIEIRHLREQLPPPPPKADDKKMP